MLPRSSHWTNVFSSQVKQSEKSGASPCPPSLPFEPRGLSLAEPEAEHPYWAMAQADRSTTETSRETRMARHDIRSKDRLSPVLVRHLSQ